ncbi:MAG TPA: hypothetical protein VKI41_10460 [Vicinamibacteria bacterium]|nr:hypothetical protein [Vicinamibacteria bacterium]
MEDLALGVGVVAPIALLLAKLIAPQTAFYDTFLSDTALTAVACLGKLLLLFLGALFAARSTVHFDRGEPVRLAWGLLALGLLSFLLGQLVLARYQILLRAPSPFPSVADVFFSLSYPLFIVALAVFIRAYQDAGYSSPAAQLWVLGAGVAAAGAAIGYRMLEPIARSPTSGLEKYLNLAYPIFDLVLLIPTVLLLRLTWRFRGGVGRVWTALLGGFVLLSVGDVLFAYFSALGQTHLDVFIHILYILCYGAIARGVIDEFRLVTA